MKQKITIKKGILYLAENGFFNFVPDIPYLRLLHYLRLGKKLNISNPKTFSEKLQWLKLYDRNPLYTELVDKYEARKYISLNFGEEYLIPLIGVWDNFDEIDFDSLPNQFVLKCTHDSGGNVICMDKSKFHMEEAKMKINRCLKRNYFYHAREWPYKNVRPRIICEQYMVDESEKELKDYKLLCFGGEVKCTSVCLNRYSKTGLNIDFYDMNWDSMNVSIQYSNSGTVIPKPKNYDKMIEFAEKVSKDMLFVRVDFYEANGHLYFGEITFYPASGFIELTPESYDYIFGDWIKLPTD